MREQVNETNRLASLLDKHALAILSGSIFITLIMVSQLVPFPEFSTEVSDFAPPNESERQIEAIELEFPPQASRIYVNVKASEQTGNPLSLPLIQDMYNESVAVQSMAEERGVTILSQINVALAVDTIISERDPSKNLMSMSSWNEVIDAVEREKIARALQGRHQSPLQPVSRRRRW